MPNIITFLILKFKNLIPLVAKLYGVNILNKEETYLFLNPAVIQTTDSNKIKLRPVKNFCNVKDGFEFNLIKTVSSSKTSVYCIKDDNVTVLAYGGIRIDNKILNLDFGSSEFIRSNLVKENRNTVRTEICIILWSHKWGGYYDFLFFIYAKLLRIKSTISDSEFENSKILYPILGRPFENELWRYAGVRDDQILDVRKYNVKASKYFCSNNHKWFYHNLNDIYLLNKVATTLSINDNSKYERIYISRKGRRKIINEEKIILILDKYGFITIEDVQRSVYEQMSIFQNAKIIIGPHGATFSNILWCKPGTIIIEIFANNYHPPYFRYLSEVLGLEYYAIFENDIKTSHHSNLHKNILVDEKYLINLLNEINHKL